MRVNLDWLREWVDAGLDATALADVLTTAGLEVDAVEPVAEMFSGVVVAEVLGCEPHPDADRLSVCRIADGQTELTVVCGAPNVRSGLRVALARVGAVLPDGKAVEAASIRGVPSQGMLCSASELGLSEESYGIIELPDDATPGVDLRAYLALDDHVLDLDLTPNRGDCFSVIGIAREISAARGVAMRPSVVAPIPASCDDRFAVRLEAAEGCPRFAGRVIRNVDAGRVSPVWLTERLRRAGIRAIHPIVDVTNYVMLELGQPLHSYDLRKLDREIIVRWATPGEQLTLLDGRMVELARDVVVIGDGSGAIGLAGIMGGASTAVEDTTVDVFLESAFFPPQAIAGRARRFGLHTDASLRFERGVDPQGQVRALERATALLLEIAGGEPGPSVDSVAADLLPEPGSIPLRGDRITAVLGQALEPRKVAQTLESLGMEITADGDNAWQVSPPSYRFDLRIEEDLIEEVARLVGYDDIPAVPEFTLTRLGLASEHGVAPETIADLLAARGYFEIISYSFIDPALAEMVDPGGPRERLANPISQELAVMRPSLWPGLLEAAARNLSRQEERLRLFEMGSQFEVGTDSVAEIPVLAGLAYGPCWPEQWGLEPRDVDFFDVKNDVESIIELTRREDELRFSAEEHPSLRPGRSARIYLGRREAGWLGELHPEVQRRLDLKKTPILYSLRLEELAQAKLAAYQPYSKFPSLRRDLAVVVPRHVAAEDLIRAVRASAGTYLQNVRVFDVYSGPGVDSSRKSIGLGLILQDTYRTLTDQDADRAVAAVVEHLGSELGATIRT